MASKFYGVVGYAEDNIEVAPGVIDSVIIERKYYGDVDRVGVRARTSEDILPDLDITHEFSIIADAYANENFFAMRYIHWAGAYWTIKQIEVRRPRLILRVGGVYNGPTFTASGDPGDDNEQPISG